MATRLLFGGFALMTLAAAFTALRLEGVQGRLEAAETRLERCAADLALQREGRRLQEKADEAYDQNRGLSDPDAARGRLRDGSFLLPGGALAP